VRLVAGMLSLTVLTAAGCQPSRMRVLGDLPAPIVRLRPAPRPIAVAPVLPVRHEVAWEPGWIPPQGISPRWTCIVLHHSASEVGGADRFDRWHRARGWDEVGYHFVIGNGTDTADGQVEPTSRWFKQKHGAHCKVPGNYYNEHGIGICLVGNFDEHPPTPAQMRSLERLLRFLMDRCGIGLDQVLTHGGITGRTNCPGRYFPLAELKRRLSMPVLAATQ